MKKIILILVSFALLVANVCFAEYSGWMSSDPNDLLPLAGSAWGFMYDYGGVTQTKLIGFSKEIVKVNDGTVCLACTDLEWEGVTVYGDYPAFNGRGFMCTLINPVSREQYKLYLFAVDGNVAIGNFVYSDTKNSSKFGISFLVGAKIANFPEDSNQPIIPDPPQEDQNQPEIPTIPPQNDSNQPTPAKALNSESSSGNDSGMGCFIQTLIAHQSSAKLCHHRY